MATPGLLVPLVLANVISMSAGNEEDDIDAKLLQLRQHLLLSIKFASNCSEQLLSLLQLPCPVAMKYAVLDIKNILKNNSQTIAQLRNIPVALNILEKYGRHLLKPNSQRNQLWRYIKFSNPIFRERVAPLKDAVYLMQLLGYTEESNDGLYFPESKEPDLEMTANVVADMLLARKELEMYLGGVHPYPATITDVLPLSIVSDVFGVGVPINYCEQIPTQPSTQMDKGTSQVPLMSGDREIRFKLCDICGEQRATVQCGECDDKLLCGPCDQMWHTHPRRHNHPRSNTLHGKQKAMDSTKTGTIQGPYGIQARPGRDFAVAPDDESESQKWESYLMPQAQRIAQTQDESTQGSFEQRKQPPLDTVDPVYFPPDSIPHTSYSKVMKEIKESKRQTPNIEGQDGPCKIDKADSDALANRKDPAGSDSTADRSDHAGSDEKGEDNGKVKEEHGMQWQCQHCTMLNGSDTRICSICHRTSDNPVFHMLTHSQITRCELEHLTPCKDQASGSKLPSQPHIGQMISQEQDQVYLEKKEAHRRHQEQLRQEELGQEEAASQECFSSQNIMIPHHPNSDAEQLNSCMKESNSIHTQLASVPAAVAAGQQREEGGGHADSISKPPEHSNFKNTMENINDQRHIKKIHLDGTDVIQLIKMADMEGFGVDDVLIALEHCDPAVKSTLDWLKDEWSSLIQNVITVATTRIKDSEKHATGTISIDEAKAALQTSDGQVEEAAVYCLNSRMELYEEVNGDGTYEEEDVLQAMNQFQGNKEKVCRQLEMMSLEAYKERMWLESDDHGLPLPATTPSTSIISHQLFTQQICDHNINLERRIRMVLVEGCLQSWGRAETVIKILEQDLFDLGEQNDYDYTLDDVVEAVRNCQDRRSSVVYLQRECTICMSTFPMTKMMNLNICQCQMCRSCLHNYFDIAIKEKHVRDWTCPVCSLPDFNDEIVAADYLNLLGLMLKNIMESEIEELFETKVRDWHLQKDPNFRWCAHCGNGFLYQGWQNGQGQLSMTCQQCLKKTCFLCKKQWEAQHEGLSCQQFEQWKIDNDPDNQATGLAKLLAESGIDCPGCKMRYSLAKGGCMHFKCPECAHEFCSGCSQPFYKQGACTRYQYCAAQGLHCHHPRDCFFYLRDNNVEELQQLLKSFKVQYNSEGSVENVTCPVLEQKDGVSGTRRDEACGEQVQQGHAGLCTNHYKEYLVSLINRHCLDPVHIMTHDQMQRLLARMELGEQTRMEKESQTQHEKRLLELIKKEIPLLR